MKLSFLLDTSVCISILRNTVGIERLPDPAFTGIPVIVAAELWTGVQKSEGTHPQNKARLEMFLSLFVIAEFTLEAAKHYADIRASLESKGTPIGPLDLLIAAQARSLKATLVTANFAEFKRVKGLLIQPWKP